MVIQALVKPEALDRERLLCELATVRMKKRDRAGAVEARRLAWLAYLEAYGLPEPREDYDGASFEPDQTPQIPRSEILSGLAEVLAEAV